MNGEHVALVTGGSRGIGAAICRRLARDGVTVLVAARGQEGCKAVAREIRGTGGQAWPLAVDVSDPASIASAMDEARMVSSAIGPVDWLVNNAGVVVTTPFRRSGAEEQDGKDLYAFHLDVNFHGPRRLVEAVLPDMLERGYGRIVNVASSAGLRGYPYVAPYCASKFALVGYTLAGASELGETGVMMNAICPWYVQSPMLEDNVRRLAEKTGRSEDEIRGSFRSQNPGGRLVGMEEVAEAVWQALAGDLNGALLELDGLGTSRRLP